MFNSHVKSVQIYEWYTCDEYTSDDVYKESAYTTQLYKRMGPIVLETKFV